MKSNKKSQKKLKKSKSVFFDLENLSNEQRDKIKEAVVECISASAGSLTQSKDSLLFFSSGTDTSNININRDEFLTNKGTRSFLYYVLKKVNKRAAKESKMGFICLAQKSDETNSGLYFSKKSTQPDVKYVPDGKERITVIAMGVDFSLCFSLDKVETESGIVISNEVASLSIVKNEKLITKIGTSMDGIFNGEAKDLMLHPQFEKKMPKSFIKNDQVLKKLVNEFVKKKNSKTKNEQTNE